jgi:hypothetical protein
MGAHHPPGYFVEAVLNPNAIVVEGEGYAGPSGLSTMPAYPDMPLVDLIDVVAYLSSLTTGHNHAMMMAAAGALPTISASARPPPQPTIHIKAMTCHRKLGEFETWFRTAGRIPRRRRTTRSTRTWSAAQRGGEVDLHLPRSAAADTFRQAGRSRWAGATSSVRTGICGGPASLPGGSASAAGWCSGRSTVPRRARCA